MIILCMIYQIAYTSLSNSPLDETTLSDILEVSQRNNDRDVITGILLYNDQTFFQVLEGKQSAVEDCYYKRIENDSRHSCLSLIWYGPTKIRAFSDWAMEYAGPREIGRYTKDTFTSLNDLNSYEAMPASTKEIVLILAQIMFSDLKIRG
jgi:hypothetical protein